MKLSRPYVQKRYKQPKKVDYTRVAENERKRHRTIARHLLNKPTAPNVAKATKHLWESTPLSTTAATINSDMQYGEAPAVGMRMQNTINLSRAAAPYLSKASSKANKLTKEFRARFGDLIEDGAISDRQLNALFYGRQQTAKRTTGKYGAYDSSTKRLNVVENGKIKTKSSIESENGHLITDYMEGRPGTHGNVKDLLSALYDLGVQRRMPVHTGEEWVATIPHLRAASSLGYKKVGDYGVHENSTLVKDGAKKVLVNSPEEAERAHALGYHFIHNNAPVYQVTRNASGITTKDINLVDPRAIDSKGRIPFDLSVHDMYRVMLPAAVTGGAWSLNNRYKNGKDSDLVLTLKQDEGFVSTWDIKNPNPKKQRPAPIINNSTNGGYTDELLKKNIKTHKRWDPTSRFDPVSGILNLTMGGNQAGGEEDQYWRAYLGLSNSVPKMNPNDATYWDKKTEDQKEQNGEKRSDFYGITPRMKYAASMVADTLNLGKLVRAGHDEYKGLYDTAKRILNNTYKYQQVKDKDVENALEMPIVNGEYNPLGMLADFGMMWDPDDLRLYLHDTYDFNKLTRILSGIPNRPAEMKIRGSVPFSPYVGSEMFNLGYRYIPDLTLPLHKNGKDSGIYIKPSHRGRFTALKKRTGHSTAWFKVHGTPALRKMATFELNSKKWHKH